MLIESRSIYCDQFLTPFSLDKMSYIARRGLSTLIPPKVRAPPLMTICSRPTPEMMLIVPPGRLP